MTEAGVPISVTCGFIVLFLLPALVLLRHSLTQPQTVAPVEVTEEQWQAAYDAQSPEEPALYARLTFGERRGA